MSNLFITTIFAKLNFLQVRIGFFSNTVRPRNMKFCAEISTFLYTYKNVLDNERIRKNIALQYLKFHTCSPQFFLIVLNDERIKKI